MTSPEPNPNEDKLRAHATRKKRALWRDVGAFLASNKKWWLLPILLALAVVAGLALLSSSPLAPFIYPLF